MLKIRVVCPLLVLACLHVCAGPLLAQRKRAAAPPRAVESNEKAWQRFVSNEGRYSVLLPGSPTKGGQVLSTGVGSLPSFSVTLKTGMAEYLISYVDFPSAFDDPVALKAAYDFGRDETLSTSKLLLVTDRDVTVGGYIGRHIKAVGNGQLFNSRIIAVDKRLYQVVMVTRDYRKNPPAAIARFEAAINKFMNSFELATGGQQAPVSVTQDNSVSIDLGRVENHVYINDSFAFRMSLPESWHLVERETTDAALQVSKELVKGTDTNTNERLDKSVAKTTILFIVTKYPLRTPNVTQAMLQCAVERLSDKSITARIYLERNRDFLLNSPLNYTLKRDVYSQTIGGVSFFVMDMEQSSGGVTVKQKYYATIRRGQALFFVTSYFVEADNIALENILQTAKFK